jgi:hypothetical protein
MLFQSAATRLDRYLQCCLILRCLLAFCPGVIGPTPTRRVNRIHLESFHGSGFDRLAHVSHLVDSVSAFVLPAGEEALRWSFDNAGSGGKKTLFKVCYALAVHAVAARNDLPLPRFLIIDTPMKNIGEEVNEDLFRSFYGYLYTLAAGPLRSVQFVIVDKEYYPPEIPGIEINERFMTPYSPQHPPLISYYRSP